MTSAGRYAALIVLLVLSTSCDGPGSPTRVPPPPPPPPGPLAITTVRPGVGFVGSGLAIQGTGFLPGAMVTLGGSQAYARVWGSDSIMAEAPRHAPGAVDVAVMNPGGETVMLSGGFLYASVSLTATPSSVMPGAELRVSWTAEASYSADWIGLFRIGDPNLDGTGIGYQRTSGASSGTQTWLAPSQPGQYEFRYFPSDYYFDDEDYVDAARSNPITLVDLAAINEGTATTSRRAGRGGAMRTRGK